jgi:O-antigen/teichoic acid export membrane protein
VTPEVTADKNTEPIPQVPSTAGMTTKVVKGSLWTLASQVAPLAVSLVTTPFVIRMLGAESYGVLILVGLIPTYLGFADCGMGIASTKFASAAYAEGDDDTEAKIVRTAALIALCSSLPLAALLIAFSAQITELFNVPEHLRHEAAIALKFAAITFVINFLNSIFNTPQLTRLRMDLNARITAGFRMLGLIAMPIAIYYGAGIVGAVIALLVASFLTLLGHLYTSTRLLNSLFESSIKPDLIKSMLKFGGGLVVSSVAVVVLSNTEKLVLTRLTSVETLAHYSVAFNLALSVTLLSLAMTQSLVPAFSQLLAPEKREQLAALANRALRLNIIMMLPAVVLLALSARPFFTIWAGEEFGRESSRPFYFLLIGLFFQSVSYIPSSLLVAAGRTDLIAKIYWILLPALLIVMYLLISGYGALGAAVSWSTCIISQTTLLAIFTMKVTGVDLRFFKGRLPGVALILAIMGIPIFLAVFLEAHPIVVFSIFLVCMLSYCFVVWKNLLMAEERRWLTGLLAARGFRTAQ